MKKRKDKCLVKNLLGKLNQSPACEVTVNFDVTGGIILKLSFALRVRVGNQ